MQAQATAQAAYIGWGRPLLSTALSKMRSVPESMRAAARIACRSSLAYSIRARQNAFVLWRIRSVRGCEVENTVEIADRTLAKSKLNHFFRKWLAHISDDIHATSQKKRTLLKLLYRNLARAFETWRAHTFEINVSLQQLQHGIVKWMCMGVAAGWQHWREVAAVCRYQFKLGMRIICRWRQSEEVHVFSALKYNASARKEKYFNYSRATCRWHVSVKKDRFQHWHSRLNPINHRKHHRPPTRNTVQRYPGHRLLQQPDLERSRKKKTGEVHQDPLQRSLGEQDPLQHATAAQTRCLLY